MKREERRSGEEIKDIQLRRAFPCAAERVGWSSGVTIGWPTICGATAQQLYITILYLAQSFHYSLSTLLSRVIGVGRKVKRKGRRGIGGRATDTEKRGKKREKRRNERGAELFCSVAMVTRRPEL